MNSRCLLVFLLSMVGTSLLADGPRDNDPTTVRAVPPKGIEVPEARRTSLQSKLDALQRQLLTLSLFSDERYRWIPDVSVFHKAVHDALTHSEFFHERELKVADELLDLGLERAALLLEKKKPWTEETGLVVRGFVSQLDSSVQPYGLVVPKSYRPNSAHKYRLDVWFHGRGERSMEVGFLNQRRKTRGYFAPEDTIVLHPYGRYSNAFKFAGEIDVLEAIEAVKREYPIDNERISVRGFSMGGAACWQFAVHYSDRWFAANPGAGFSETPKFLKSFQKETLRPTWYEEKLWRLYDCDLWAENLLHCPTVAYSGEKDIQKQAADVMQSALRDVGIDLVHIIGAGMGHRYDQESVRVVDQKLAGLARKGRERTPRNVSLTTYTLRYPKMHWVTVEALGEHWEKATVRASIVGVSSVNITAKNVTRLKLSMPAGESPFALQHGVNVRINGDPVSCPRPRSDLSWNATLELNDSCWALAKPPGETLRKKHGLQGPIDDAFMSRFLFVKPTGSSKSEKLNAWAKSELERAQFEWRRHFRGDAPLKLDSEVNDKDIANSNLVLWGDPQSNSVLKRLADKLPIRWLDDAIQLGSQRFDTSHHAVILVFPNPLNPDRYVVLNSGFTYREYAYLNNARQVPKLPDWAIIDLNTKPDTLWPGKVVAADFFDESWKLKNE